MNDDTKAQGIWAVAVVFIALTAFTAFTKGCEHTEKTTQIRYVMEVEKSKLDLEIAKYKAATAMPEPEKVPATPEKAK